MAFKTLLLTLTCALLLMSCGGPDPASITELREYEINGTSKTVGNASTSNAYLSGSAVNLQSAGTAIFSDFWDLGASPSKSTGYESTKGFGLLKVYGVIDRFCE